MVFSFINSSYFNSFILTPTRPFEPIVISILEFYRTNTTKTTTTIVLLAKLHHLYKDNALETIIQTNPYIFLRQRREKKMLKSHLQQSTKSLIPWSTKPFDFSREILDFFPINILSKNHRKNKKNNNFIVHYNVAKSTKAVLGSTKKSMGVKVVVKVQKSVGGTNLGLSRGLDDLLGKSLLVWIVAAELDPSKYSFTHA